LEIDYAENQNEIGVEDKVKIDKLVYMQKWAFYVYDLEKEE